jgi:hypothetical protein
MGMDGVVSWLEASSVVFPIRSVATDRGHGAGRRASHSGGAASAHPTSVYRLSMYEVLPQGTPGPARPASLWRLDSQGLKRPKSSGFSPLR